MNAYKKNILLIEDETNLSNALASGLETGGFRVMLAENGQKGLDLLKKEKVDLIVMDVIMPFFDGVWFMRQLGESDQLPIIALTNLTHGEKVSEIMKLGVRKVLVKTDTSISQLIENINESLMN